MSCELMLMDLSTLDRAQLADGEPIAVIGCRIRRAYGTRRAVAIGRNGQRQKSRPTPKGRTAQGR